MRFSAQFSTYHMALGIHCVATINRARVHRIEMTDSIHFVCGQYLILHMARSSNVTSMSDVYF